MENKSSMKLIDLLKQYENISSYDEKVMQKRNVIRCISEKLMEMHSNNYIVDSFSPSDIVVYPDNIEFKCVSYYGDDKEDEIKFKQKTEENIFDCAVLSLKIYLNYFGDIDISYLKRNFNEFAFAFPDDDVKYFRGVILNNLSVYFTEFYDENRRIIIQKLKDSAFVSINIFGLIISIIGFLICFIAVLYKFLCG